MKVEELFKAIEPMAKQVEKGTTLLMLGCDDKKEYGCITGKGEDMISMLVNLMIKDEFIEKAVMIAVEVFADRAEHLKNKANDPRVS